MSAKRNIQPLRLPKKHASRAAATLPAGAAKRLLAAQSLRDAVVAGLITIVIFSLFWVLLTRLSGRLFPWMTIVLGLLLGFAIRYAGRGVDWRFPALAALLTLAGSLASNIVIAASYTAETFDTGILHILSAVTTMTWPVYFSEVVNAADYIYAAIAAVLAAFLANRRLNRAEYRALRLWREG